jgi:hypothetical protein
MTDGSDDILAQMAAHLDNEEASKTMLVLLAQRVAQQQKMLEEHEAALAPVKQGRSLFMFLLMLGTFAGSALALMDRMRGKQ